MNTRTRRAVLALITSAAFVGLAACSGGSDPAPVDPPATTEVASDEGAADIADIADALEAQLLTDGDTLAAATSKAEVQDALRSSRDTIFAADTDVRDVTVDSTDLTDAVDAFLASNADAIAAIDAATTVTADDLNDDLAFTAVASIGDTIIAANDLSFAAKTALGEPIGDTAPSASAATIEQITDSTGDSEVQHSIGVAPDPAGFCGTGADQSVEPVAVLNTAHLSTNFTLYERVRVFASDDDATAWMEALNTDANDCPITADQTAIRSAEDNGEGTYVIDTMSIDLTPTAYAFRQDGNVVFSVAASADGAGMDDAQLLARTTAQSLVFTLNENFAG